MIPFNGLTQSFSPAAGQPGTTAIHKDSSIFIAWANGIILERGYLNIADTAFQLNGSNKVSFGNPANALGMAEGNATDIVSLGDLGIATLTVVNPIIDGPGYDFAVFENSFSDSYLELAHVAVSSDGIHFVQFESTSETPLMNQVGPYGTLVPEYLNNLAGKYRGAYGTPFDLQELAGSPLIDLQNIRFVRITDCVGSIDSLYGTEDSQGNLINDPFPTPWESGGFDLDGLGVIHNQEELAEIHSNEEIAVKLYPNPSNGQFYIQNSASNPLKLMVFDQLGKLHHQEMIQSNLVLLDLNLDSGIYWVQITDGVNSSTEKLVVQ